MNFVATFFFIFFAKGAVSLPHHSNITPKSDSYYAGRASRIIATNLLKENIDIDGNDVYSPLGIASVLAILAEGSTGTTYEEFGKALGYPSSKADLRESFRRVLANFNADHSQLNGVNPSFRTWMYIYRNNTARDEYKQILRDCYYVEVEDINREENDWSEPDTSQKDSLPVQDNGKDVIGFESLKTLRPFPDDNDSVDDEDVGEAVRSALPLEENLEHSDEVQKESSKFDKFVDDKQYVETPLIKEEIAKEQLVAAITTDEVEFDEVKSTEKLTDDVDVEENETIGVNEKIDGLRKNFASNALTGKVVSESNEPEKITIPLQKLEDGGMDIKAALTSHFSSSSRANAGRTLFLKDDIASALSANSITGREFGSKTKMLLFNGLFYRSNWAHPFQELRSGHTDPFYVTKEKTMPIKMMRSRGKFRSAECESLNARAIEFPYENQRYSLVVIYPNERDGLRSVIEKLEPSHLSALKSVLKESQMFISLPKFQIEETSRSETMLMRLGLNTLFSREHADLSAFSQDTDLHVDEIVQFVNIRVDEGASSENSLTATTGRTAGADETEVVIDRPFLYFVMDREEDFVLVSGKITAPEFKEEDDFDLDIEYSLS